MKIVSMSYEYTTGQAILYFADINGEYKFGVTNNWERRLQLYIKELGDVPIKKFKEVHFDLYWQAELIEQVMVHRLRDYTQYVKREWMDPRTNVKLLMNCFQQTREVLEKEYNLHKDHLANQSPRDRRAYCKQQMPMLQTLFDKNEKERS